MQEYNERILWQGRPHIAGFLWFYGILFYGAVLVLFVYPYVIETVNQTGGMRWYAVLNEWVTWLGLVFFPLVILTVRKIQFRWSFIGCVYILCTISAQQYLDLTDPFRWVLGCFVIIGFLWIEFHRRSYSYLIGERSLIIQVNGLKTWIRRIPYHAISDFVLEQGVLGKILKVGTIIPVTHSGFGLGDDAVFGGGAVGVSPVKRLFGGFLAGGMRSQQRPRSEPQFVLYGVKNPQNLFRSIDRAQGVQQIKDF